MNRYALAAVVALGGMQALPAAAEITVECHSEHGAYHECNAGPVTNPVLIRQTSGADCILNRTWGYNPNTDRIWVSNYCGGVFANPQGYHHGRSNSADEHARVYNEHGFDVGLATGAVLGAGVVALAEHDKHHHHHHK